MPVERASDGGRRSSSAGAGGFSSSIGDKLARSWLRATRRITYMPRDSLSSASSRSSIVVGDNTRCGIGAVVGRNSGAWPSILQRRLVGRIDASTGLGVGHARQVHHLAQTEHRPDARQKTPAYRRAEITAPACSSGSAGTHEHHVLDGDGCAAAVLDRRRKPNRRDRQR